MARTPANRMPLQQAAGMLMQPAVVPRMEIQNLKAYNRINRNPYEDFAVWQQPWDIQPFMLMPVLPGETLTNMQMQSRLITDPIKGQLSGWWAEYYFFYVKHSDLEAQWPTLLAMHLENAATTAVETNTRADKYFKRDTMAAIPWTQLCTEVCVKWYFRDGGEPLGGYGNHGVRTEVTTPANGGTIYKARVRDPMWLESLKIEDVNPTGQGDLPGVEDFQDVFVPTAWSTHYTQWENMRQLKLIPEDVSFEDYLSTFGVKVPERVKETEHRPELLRYLRHWQYPSNTVDGGTGGVASAVSWAISARADKARAFSEPGFIIGLSVIRPKVFMANQSHHATVMLNDAYGWLPAVLRDEPFTSLIEYDHNEGPIRNIFNSADDYWVDRRDLYVKGGQFMTGTIADMRAQGFPMVDLPSSSGDNDLNMWYASQTDVSNLFTGPSLAVPAPTKIQCRQDGIVRLTIKSHVHSAVDHT